VAVANGRASVRWQWPMGALVLASGRSGRVTQGRWRQQRGSMRGKKGGCKREVVFTSELFHCSS
jgi:hypothetical protein